MSVFRRRGSLHFGYGVGFYTHHHARMPPPLPSPGSCPFVVRPSPAPNPRASSVPSRDISGVSPPWRHPGCMRSLVSGCFHSMCLKLAQAVCKGQFVPFFFFFLLSSVLSYGNVPCPGSLYRNKHTTVSSSGHPPRTSKPFPR